MPCKGCISPLAGTATHGKAGSDGVMCRTTYGGSLFHTDSAERSNAYLYTLMIGVTVLVHITDMCGMLETYRWTDANCKW